MKNFKKPQTAWLFDIDGVLTDPEKKRVTNPKIFEELIRRLKIDEPVGLNTGRSLDFIINEVLDPLEERIERKEILRNVVAIGEKGGAWIVYDDEGKRTVEVDENISVPTAVQEKIRELIKTDLYSETVFYDETKKTMVSIELKINKTIEDFEKIKQQLTNDLEDVLSEFNIEKKYKIDPTRIAVDVENINVGKALGARKFVEFLDKKEIKPVEFMCFGDSVSDYDMYEELKIMEKKVKFIFVGGEKYLLGKNTNEVEFTDKLFDLGTLGYIQNNR